MENTKRNKIIFVVMTALIVVVTLTASYAYFTSFTEGETLSTIYTTGGLMNVTFIDEDANINVSNVYPKEEAWADKTFVISGVNTTDLNMGYAIDLVVVNNEFTEENGLTYSLTASNSNSNGETIAEEESVILSNGSYTKRIGTGYFVNTGKTINDKRNHTYSLKIFFKPAEADQNINQTKKFAAYVTVSSYDNK